MLNPKVHLTSQAAHHGPCDAFVWLCHRFCCCCLWLSCQRQTMYITWKHVAASGIFFAKSVLAIHVDAVAYNPIIWCNYFYRWAGCHLWVRRQALQTILCSFSCLCPLQASCNPSMHCCIWQGMHHCAHKYVVNYWCMPLISKSSSARSHMHLCTAICHYVLVLILLLQILIRT